jgi:hypothetical protein
VAREPSRAESSLFPKLVKLTSRAEPSSVSHRATSSSARLVSSPSAEQQKPFSVGWKLDGADDRWNVDEIPNSGCCARDLHGRCRWLSRLAGLHGTHGIFTAGAGSSVEFIVSVVHLLSTKLRCAQSGPEAGRSAVRTVRACGPDGPRTRRTD